MTIEEEGPSTQSAATPASNPIPPFRHRRSVRITSAAALALGLAVGGGAIANAATSTSTSTQPSASGVGPHSDGPGGPGRFGRFGGTPPAAMGTVASVGTNSFTLTARDGTTVTVDVGSSTTYLDHDVTSPSIADVKVGDHVAVFGTSNAGTVTATKVAIGGPGGPGGHGGHDGKGGPGGPGGMGGPPPAAMGTVASVGTNSFTLTTRDGTTVTVDVSSSTSYLKFGSTSAALGDVTVGAHVAVFGTDTANTVTATKVGIAPSMHGDGDMPPAPNTAAPDSGMSPTT